MAGQRPQGGGGPQRLTTLTWVQPPTVREEAAGTVLTTRVEAKKGDQRQAGINIHFNVDGSLYGPFTTDVHGQTTFTLPGQKFSAGTHVVIAEVDGQSATVQGSFTIAESATDAAQRTAPKLAITLGTPETGKGQSEVPVTVTVTQKGKLISGVKVEITVRTSSGTASVPFGSYFTNSNGTVNTVMTVSSDAKRVCVDARAVVVVGDEEFPVFDTASVKIDHPSQQLTVDYSQAVRIAPGKYSIRVMVVGEDKKPVEGIEIYAIGGILPVNGKTNANGIADLELICLDNVAVTKFTVHTPGVETQEYKLVGKSAEPRRPREETRLGPDSSWFKHLCQALRFAAGISVERSN